MVINVHEDGPNFWSLGLARVHGSMLAEKCVELVRKKLEGFGLNLDSDIVANCTDGVSVMCKVGKQQLCLAHSVHLAVKDVLYKRKAVETSSSRPQAVIDSPNRPNQDSDHEEEDSQEATGEDRNKYDSNTSHGVDDG
jgi:hypothetical protein